MLPFESVYVHFPFCRSKCPYCDFYSGVFPERVQDDFVAALEAEVVLRRPGIPAGGVRTVYWGGGTPLLLSEARLERCAAIIKPLCGERTSEWSVEGTPGSVTAEKSALLAACGVNRVTLGVQSLEPQVRQELGRPDGFEQFLRAVQLLREAGIVNIGADLIIGLPGETAAGFSRGVEQLLESGISHLSAYFLRIEEGAAWHAPFMAGTLRPASDALMLRSYNRLYRLLQRRGWEQYEVANFCRPGFRSLHNGLTWQYRTLLGLGPAAVGYDGVSRRRNTASLEEYCAALLRGIDCDSVCEKLTGRERFNEHLLLGLRTVYGLDPVRVASDTGFPFPSTVYRQLDQYAAEGWLSRTDRLFRPTRRGFLWLDEMLSRCFL